MSDSIAPLQDPVIFERLTPRERETLRRTAAGESAKEIGRALGISHRTVHNYQQEAARKLGVSGSVRAARLLVDHEAGGGVDLHPASVSVAPTPSRLVSPASSVPIAASGGQPETAATSAVRSTSTGRMIRVSPTGVLLIIIAWGVGGSLTLAAVTYLYTSLAAAVR